MNDTGNRVIVGIVAVLVVIGAWYLGTTLKSSSGMKGAMATSTSTSTTGTGSVTGSTSQTGTTAGATSSDTGAVSVGGEAVSVADQPAGSFVVVSATLPADGWVAVRDSMGKTLGAGWFTAGMHEAVQVPLLRNTESGETYQVLLYTDDGDHAFDLHKDTLVTNADGTVAGASFTASNGD